MEDFIKHLSSVLTLKIIAMAILAQAIMSVVFQILIPTSVLVSFIGIMSIFLSIFTWYTSEEFENHFSFYGILFLFKLVTIGFLLYLALGETKHYVLLFHTIIDFLIILSLGFKLNNYYIFSNEAFFDLKKINDLFKFVRTNQGEVLADLGNNKKVLMVFVRHFGCTFCRENVDEISKLKTKLEDLNLVPVFVHMSDPAFAEDFFQQYFDQKINFVSDPNLSLYKAFGLKRGSLLQLYGLKTWLRGFYAGVIKGHGLGSSEGDVMQLGGYYIYHKGQVEFLHPHESASEVFNLTHVESALK